MEEDPPPPPEGLPPSDGTAEDAEAQDDNLRTSLRALSRLTLAGVELESSLTRIARYAVRAIPLADGAGLTLLERDRADTLVATDPFVRAVDEIQYGLRQGPCISAAAEGLTVVSGSLGGDRRWPQFGSRAARLGVHSVISLPLTTHGVVLGAMNVYAHAKHAFTEHAADLGELFAVPAAITVQNAQAMAHAQRLTEQLRAALEQRVVIDQAVGILMSRSGTSDDEALARLRTLSQHQHLKLSLVAQRVVDEAVRRARHRLQDEGDTS